MISLQHNGGRGDILIVDDELPNLQALSAILTEKGYDVRGVRLKSEMGSGLHS